ncbi:MAG: type II toxin-antitoxin system VapC family toxin [Pyrinomonadaceae bacterium]
MRSLLDTHAFLWSVAEPRRLPPKIATVLQDPEKEINLSAVSIWETAIKLRAGRMDLQGRTAEDVLDEAVAMNLRLIDLTPDDAAGQSLLTENTHFDPFDRMLIWQAISRGLTLMSGDKEFTKFKKDGLSLLWK